VTVRLGLNAKMYHNTGTFATPVWNEITDAQDVTVNYDKGEAEVKRRGGQYRLHLLHLKEFTIDFEMLHDTDTDDYDIFSTAYFQNTLLDMLVLDAAQAAPGSAGVRAECGVKTFTENQPLEEVLTNSVQLRPAPTLNAQPVQFTVP
jgi:hypothetical protein